LKKGGNQLKIHELGHTSPIEEKRQPLVILAISIHSASDTTIMGDFPTSTAAFSAATVALPADLVCQKIRGLLKVGGSTRRLIFMVIRLFISSCSFFLAKYCLFLKVVLFY
jgi:hypothetical protein